jgi:hypothetical protein
MAKIGPVRFNGHSGMGLRRPMTMVRRRFWLVPVLIGAGVVATTAVGVATNLATDEPLPPWLEVLAAHPWWLIGGLTAFLAIGSAAVWRLQHAGIRVPAAASSAPVEPPPWLVDRPSEVDRIVAALARRGGGSVGITTGLQGAGGFGKTTLAAAVYADRRIRRRFRRRIWVTIGRDARASEAAAAKVNDVIKLVAPGEDTFINPEQAGQRLGCVA